MRWQIIPSQQMGGRRASRLYFTQLPMWRGYLQWVWHPTPSGVSKHVFLFSSLPIMSRQGSCWSWGSGLQQPRSRLLLCSAGVDQAGVSFLGHPGPQPQGPAPTNPAEESMQWKSTESAPSCNKQPPQSYNVGLHRPYRFADKKLYFKPTVFFLAARR